MATLKKDLIDLLDNNFNIDFLKNVKNNIKLYNKKNREDFLKEKYKNEKIEIDNTEEEFNIYEFLDNPTTDIIGDLIIALENFFSTNIGIADKISQYIQQDFINSNQWHYNILSEELGEIKEIEQDNKVLKSGGLETFKVLEYYNSSFKNYNIVYLLSFRQEIKSNEVLKNELLDRIINKLKYKALGILFADENKRINPPIIKHSKDFEYTPYKEEERHKYNHYFSYQEGVKRYVFIKFIIKKKDKNIILNYDKLIWEDIYNIFLEYYINKDIDYIKIQDFSSIIAKYPNNIKEIEIYFHLSYNDKLEVSSIIQSDWDKYSNKKGIFTIPINKTDILEVERKKTLIILE